MDGLKEATNAKSGHETRLETRHLLASRGYWQQQRRARGLHALLGLSAWATKLEGQDQVLVHEGGAFFCTHHHQNYTCCTLRC